MDRGAGGSSRSGSRAGGGKRRTEMNPEMPARVAQKPPPLEPKVVGYCRACGKSLDETEARTSHGTIYCQDHVPQEPFPIQAVPPPISSSPYTAPYAAPIASPYTAPQIV